MSSMLGPNQKMSFWRAAADPTTFLLKLMGIGLLISFICPLQTSHRKIRLVFLNIESLFKKAPFIFKIELIYLLIAGIALLIIAKQKRSQVKAAGLAAIGLFPFLLLLASPDVQKFVGRSLRNVPGLNSPAWFLIISFVTTLLILAGAYAVFVKPGLTLACQIAAAGGGLTLLMLLVPRNGEFSFIAPFKLMFSRDRTGMGFNIAGGLLALVIIVITILYCIKCYQLLKQDREFAVKRQDAGTVLHLWFSQFYVFGVFFLYIMLVALIRSSGSRGIIAIFNLILAIIKMFPWIMSLFLLVPLGIAELLIMKEVPPGSEPAAAD